MRLHEFLDALEQTPRRWSLMAHGAMRLLSLDGRCHNCPISAVRQAIRTHGEAADPFEAHVLDTEHGISTRTMRRIMHVADGLQDDPSLRQRLLKACGLTTQRAGQE